MKSRKTRTIYNLQLNEIGSKITKIFPVCTNTAVKKNYFTYVLFMLKIIT